jgi:flavin-dependent dehydrogenase
MVWRYFDLLGATEAIESVGFIRKSGGTVSWDGTVRQMSFANFGFTRTGLHVERGDFDEILLRTAEARGARVFEGVAAIHVELDGPTKRVAYRSTVSGEEGTVSGKYVIDASGQAAVVARQLGHREFDRDLRFMSVWGYFGRTGYVEYGGSVQPFERRREIPATTLQVQVGRLGWCWHILQREQVSVGLVLPPDELVAFKASGETLEERFLRACRTVPIVSDLLDLDSFIPGSVLAIRDFAYYPRELSGSGWFLTGDAAAFVDPINSSGVPGAFYTGHMAALATDESLRHASRSEEVRERYDTLQRGSMALYRLSAMPVGENSYPEMYEHALRRLLQASLTERELIYAQMEIVCRTENLSPLYAMAPQLDRLDTRHVRTLEGPLLDHERARAGAAR